MNTWMVMDVQNCDEHWFPTQKEAEDCIKELIQNENENSVLDGGYSPECEQYYLFHLAGRARLEILKKREEQVLDEEGYDEEGMLWADNWRTISNLLYSDVLVNK